MSIKTVTMTMVSTACLIACASLATAQTSVDRSFNSVSKDCGGIQWSERALATYPTIASACQGVEERNGKTYVKFSGKLNRNVNKGEQLVIVASKGGHPQHPAWYVNLRENPEVYVQVHERKFRATARTAAPSEKPKLWDEMVAIWPDYAEYQKKTERDIPVVILEPTPAEEES